MHNHRQKIITYAWGRIYYTLPQLVS